jgi:hypothetical protein
MDAHYREKAQQDSIEKMLGEALRRGSPPAREACPEPDLLAAYLEQTLSPAEKEILEPHISDCTHCQEVLSTLAATALEPALAEEFVMAAASAMPTARPHAARDLETARAPALHAPAATTAARTSWFTLHWRWLTPAVSLAAVAALWFAIGQPLHPPATVDVTSSTPAPAVPPPHTPESTSKADADQLAKNLEPPPSGGRQRSNFSVKRKSALDSIPKGHIGAVEPSASGSAVTEKTPSAAPPSKPSAVPGLTSVSPQIAAAERSESGKLADGKKESREASARALGGIAGNAVVSSPPAAPPPAAQKTMQAPAQMPAQAQVTEAPSAGMTPGLAMRDTESRSMAMQKAALPSPHTIATPDPLILWRAGVAGKIERSEDGGKTWQTQSSGVPANLTSGSAPSVKICWVVGAGGVILRTTDGEHWEKIVSPAPLNWIRVVAEDAQRAIITSAEQKQYVTTDGGKTWMPQ